MKKIFFIIFGVAVILIILLGIAYFSINKKQDTSGSPDYYRNLAKECKSKQSYNCCITSVNNMADGNYLLLAPKTGCPEGYQPDMLECIDSFKWCEPTQRVSECEKSGGKESNLTECSGDVSKICTLPNGEECYLENLRNGSCKGIFSPKVLCDNEQ